MMKLGDNEPHRNSRALFFNALVALTLLGFVGVSSAFGASTYSDEWVDDSNQGAGYINGCGVSEGMYTHRYYIDTTLSSPNNRSAFRESVETVGYARADVSLPWDWNDMGDYYTNSAHYQMCPYGEINWLYAASTVGSGKAGFSKICYQWDHYDASKLNPQVYKIVDGCGSRISCWNTYFYSFYNVGMRGKSVQGWFEEEFTGIKICTYVQGPIIGGACDEGHCQDVVVVEVP